MLSVKVPAALAIAREIAGRAVGARGAGGTTAIDIALVLILLPIETRCGGQAGPGVAREAPTIGIVQAPCAVVAPEAGAAAAIHVGLVSVRDAVEALRGAVYEAASQVLGPAKGLDGLDLLFRCADQLEGARHPDFLLRRTCRINTLQPSMTLRCSPFLPFLLLVAASLPTGVLAHEAGGYRVAFIRAGAGGYNHGGNFLARVGRSVLVGSPSEFSSADVYNGRTGALEHHLSSRLPFDEALLFGGGVAAARTSFLVSDPFQNAVYLFGRRDGRLRRTLRPPPEADSERFGTGIAEVAKTIVVGDPNGGATIGPVYAPGPPGSAFLFDTGSGNPIRTIVDPSPSPNGQFGRTVVRGAGGFAIAKLGNYYEPGTVYIYDQDGNLRQTLQATTPAPRDRFGSALAADGARLLIGKPGPGGMPGEVFLYQRRRGQYALARTLIPAEGRALGFGQAVDLVGRRAVVGSAESATLFDCHTGVTLATLTEPVPDPENLDFVPYLPWGGLGDSVAIVGRTIVVGSRGADEDAGSIIVGFAPSAKLPPECGAPYPCPNEISSR